MKDSLEKSYTKINKISLRVRDGKFVSCGQTFPSVKFPPQLKYQIKLTLKSKYEIILYGVTLDIKASQ